MMRTDRVGYACAHAMRDIAGSATAPAARLKTRRRGCCVTNRRSLPRDAARRRGVVADAVQPIMQIHSDSLASGHRRADTQP